MSTENKYLEKIASKVTDSEAWGAYGRSMGRGLVEQAAGGIGGAALGALAMKSKGLRKGVANLTNKLLVSAGNKKMGYEALKQYSKSAVGAGAIGGAYAGAITGGLHGTKASIQNTMQKERDGLAKKANEYTPDEGISKEAKLADAAKRVADAVKGHAGTVIRDAKNVPEHFKGIYDASTMKGVPSKVRLDSIKGDLTGLAKNRAVQYGAGVTALGGSYALGREKKAAYDALIADGVNFDMAVEFVKQASIELYGK